jgi:hypothetical protein
MSRDKGKEDFWRGHINAQGVSGLPVRVYCQREGLKWHTFYAWRRELVRRDGQSVLESAPAPEPLVQQAPRFLAVHVPSPAPPEVPLQAQPSSGLIEVLPGGGMVVRVHGVVEVEGLRRVLLALGGLSC